MKYILILSIILIGCGKTSTPGWSSPPKECDQFYDTEETQKACNSEKGGDTRSEECHDLLHEAYKKCYELTGYVPDNDFIVVDLSHLTPEEFYKHKMGDFNKPTKRKTSPDTPAKQTPADKKQ